jgi:TaqI-like C-terminal specificity domain/Eco57I restriction-modification methylase
VPRRDGFIDGSPLRVKHLCYGGTIDRAVRKQLGVYYTPAWLVKRALEAVSAPPPGARVVDLACGEGVWLREAAARWPGVRTLGIDVQPAPGVVVGDGLSVEVGGADLVVGNPPWGAGRGRNVRRGAESASAFVARSLEILNPGGRLCLILPAAWLEVAAHRAARRRLLSEAAIERIELLGDVFPGVFAPAALLVARREPVEARRRAQQVWTPAGAVRQSELTDQLVVAVDARGRELLSRLAKDGQRLRALYILGVVTGGNRQALGDGEGEPILTGRDVEPFHLRRPTRRLVVPLERVQQAAPRAAYQRPKVVYRFIARHPVAAVDDEGRLTLNSANAVAPEEWDPRYVAAVLNSTPARFVHRARWRMVRVLRSHLETLPFPPATAAERRRISMLEGEAADERVMDLYRLGDDERAWLRKTWPAS